MPYVEAELARGVRLNQMTRHILGLFHGQPRARAFRRVLAERRIGSEEKPISNYIPEALNNLKEWVKDDCFQTLPPS